MMPPLLKPNVEPHWHDIFKNSSVRIAWYSSKYVEKMSDYRIDSFKRIICMVELCSGQFLVEPGIYELIQIKLTLSYSSIPNRLPYVIFSALSTVLLSNAWFWIHHQEQLVRSTYAYNMIPMPWFEGLAYMVLSSNKNMWLGRVYPSKLARTSPGHHNKPFSVHISNVVQCSLDYKCLKRSGKSVATQSPKNNTKGMQRAIWDISSDEEGFSRSFQEIWVWRCMPRAVPLIM